MKLSWTGNSPVRTQPTVCVAFKPTFCLAMLAKLISFEKIDQFLRFDQVKLKTRDLTMNKVHPAYVTQSRLHLFFFALFP